MNVLAILRAEVVTMRRLEAWVEHALEGTTLDASEAIANIEHAYDAVTQLLAAAQRALPELESKFYVAVDDMGACNALRHAITRMQEER